MNIEAFLARAPYHPVIDVRSPAEYKIAHIPGAFNLPLFNDDERSVVGTAYKQESREKAIKEGLKYFGPKMVSMIELVEKLVEPSAAGIADQAKNKTYSNKTLLVHCWRGGMRSAGVAWLLNLYGFNVYTLEGGYKSFRQWAHQQFSRPRSLKIIGGYTGSGKTDILNALARHGQAVVDLEGLGNHKGSSFGSIGMPPQPSQEMFENLLAVQLATFNVPRNTFVNEARGTAVLASPAKSVNTLTIKVREDVSNNIKTALQENDLVVNTENDPVIWLEDESQRVGNLNIPQGLWQQMRTAPVYFFNIPFEERLDYIVKGYGKGDKEKIISAVLRIKKRLGGLETKNAINFLLEDNLKECFRLLLTYYDKYYLKSLHTRENLEQLVQYIDVPVVNASSNASILLNR